MKNKKFYYQLGINIKNRRNELGITQQQLADIIGVGLNHIGKIEVAYKKPSLDLLLAIASALNIELDKLLNFKNNNQ